MNPQPLSRPFVTGAVMVLLTCGTHAATPPTLAGCPLFPASSIWNTAVDSMPLDPNSALYVSTIGSDRPVHPDFGSGEWPPNSGAPIGIPYLVIPPDQPTVAVTFAYADESDPGPYPIPPDAPIEGGPNATGDRHVLLVDAEQCRLYELYHAFPQTDGTWRAGSGAIYDLNSNQLRPEGWTSSDAAGLPILPGLVRYDEVAGGTINHALRFTAPQTRGDHVWPARHHASSLVESRYPPMGQRFRLRPDFDLEGYTPHVQVILRALQKYGMILADNGSAWYLSGTPHESWDNDALRELRQVHGSDFEAMDVRALIVDADSASARVPVPRIQQARRNLDHLEITIANLITGATYRIERSTDLDHWESRDAFFPVEPTELRVLDLDTQDNAAFFRARL